MTRSMSFRLIAPWLLVALAGMAVHDRCAAAQPSAVVLASREYKVLLKPAVLSGAALQDGQFLDSRGVRDYWSRLQQQVKGFPDLGEPKKPRTVSFYDTKNRVFRANHFILRGRKGEKPKDTDLTLKCRDEDRNEVTAFGQRLGQSDGAKIEFGEERVPEGSGVRTVYSCDVGHDGVAALRGTTLAALYESFPGARGLPPFANLNGNESVDLVGHPVTEVEFNPKFATPDQGARGEVQFSFWFDTQGKKLLIAEIAFKMKPSDKGQSLGATPQAEKRFHDLLKYIVNDKDPRSSKTQIVYDLAG